MAITSSDLYEQAVAQTGQLASGLSAGARGVLISHVEKLADKYGLGGTVPVVKELLTSKCGMDISSETYADDEQSLPQKCMKESGAAAMSALVNGSANILHCLGQLRRGELPEKNALVKVIGETVAAATDSALKAAGTAGKQMMIEKYGSEEKAIQAFAEQGISLLCEKLPVSEGGKQLLQNLKNLVNLGEGKISLDECMRQAGSLFTNATTASHISSIAGEGAMSLVKLKLPAVMKIMPKHPAVLAASIMVVVAKGIAIKNGIERPYQDLVRNTTTLKEAASELDRVVRNLLQGQVLFGKILESDAEMETRLQNQMSAVDKAGKNALDAILKI